MGALHNSVQMPATLGCSTIELPFFANKRACALPRDMVDRSEGDDWPTVTALGEFSQTQNPSKLCLVRQISDSTFDLSKISNFYQSNVEIGRLSDTGP